MTTFPQGQRSVYACFRTIIPHDKTCVGKSLRYDSRHGPGLDDVHHTNNLQKQTLARGCDLLDATGRARPSNIDDRATIEQIFLYRTYARYKANKYKIHL